MKGSLKRGGTWSVGGDGGRAGDLEGGVGDSLRSGASEIEMYVGSSMAIGVGEESLAMSEGSGWRLDVEVLSFYLGGGGACDTLGSTVERTHLVDVPRNCRPWDILST